MQQPNPFTIFTGDAKTMNLKAVYAETGNPFDISSATEIDIALPNADGSFTHLLLSASQVAITSPGVLGQFTAPISAANSALLNIGELQNVDVTFTIDSKPQTVRYYQALSVFSRN